MSERLPGVAEAAFVVRPQPTPGAWRRSLGGASAGLLALGLASLAKLHGTGLIVELSLLLVVIAGGVVLLLLGNKRMNFTLDDGVLWFTGRISRRKVFAVHAPGKVAEVNVVWWGGGNAPLPLWALVNAEGVCEAAVIARRFDAGQLEELRSRLQLPRDVVQDPIPATKVLTAYPGILPWWYAHIYGVAAVAFLLAVLVVAVLN